MRTVMWRILGRQAPVQNKTRREAAKKALQQLWVAGTVGAFFSALARNLPIHLSQTSLAEFDLIYTLTVFLKYGYVIWLLGYFFYSALDNDLAEAGISSKDIAFDIVQSIVSLAAAYFLGFIIPIQVSGMTGFTAANFAVLFICLLSFGLYHRHSKAGVNHLRLAGAVVSFIGAFFSVLGNYAVLGPGQWATFVILFLLGVLLLGLYLLLYAYFRIGIDESV